jgi:hypothetical protein
MHPAGLSKFSNVPVLHYSQAVLFLKMSHDTEATSSKRKLRKYDSAIDTSCAFETNDLNLTTANFDSYGNVSFDPV